MAAIDHLSVLLPHYYLEYIVVQFLLFKCALNEKGSMMLKVVLPEFWFCKPTNYLFEGGWQTPERYVFITRIKSEGPVVLPINAF